MHKGQFGVHHVKLNVPAEYLEIVQSIYGQLSDGYWENSKSQVVQGIWKFSRPITMPNSEYSENVYISIMNEKCKMEEYNRHCYWSYNYFHNQTSEFISNELAQRLKTLARVFAKMLREDGVALPKQYFSTDCDVVIDWLGYDKTWTMGDMRKVYDYLLGQN